MHKFFRKAKALGIVIEKSKEVAAMTVTGMAMHGAGVACEELSAKAQKAVHKSLDAIKGGHSIYHSAPSTPAVPAIPPSSITLT